MITFDNSNDKKIKNLDDCIYLHGFSVSSYLFFKNLAVFILIIYLYLISLLVTPLPTIFTRPNITHFEEKNSRQDF